MIGIFYIGDKRFESVTRENHRKAIAAIESVAPVTVYDFTQPNLDRSGCPYINTKQYTSGGIQLWDFLTAAELIKENTIIKFRTDLWFAQSSLAVLASHVERVVRGAVDIDFLGCTAQDGTNKLYSLTDYSVKADPKKVRDLVIISKKHMLPEKQRIIDRHSNQGRKQVSSGNRAFTGLINKRATCINTYCQIYLVREEYINPSDQQVSSGFIQGYVDKASKEAMAWYLGDQPR